MVNQMSSKKTDKSTKKENRFLNGVKAHKKHNTASYSRKKISSDDEDEDDLALNGDDYDSKDELKLSDDEEKPQRNGSKRSPLPPAPVPTSSTLRTLSDSDSSKSEPKWLCKPRLNGVKSTNKSHQVRRKRAFIPSSSSEEDIDDSSSRQDEKPVVTLKQMVKKTKKSRAKKGTNSSDESDAIDSEENAHFDSDTDSDDSRVG
ncbi:unnamed protein product, partial [Anisakis simplex]|uniref:Uncharacterized protein n=1 Tax=Anisakis simplex TaxID=6269 RepID=A0A0M3JAF0_ANISI